MTIETLTSAPALSQAIPTHVLPTVKDVQHKFPFLPRQVRIDAARVCAARCLFCHRFGDFRPNAPTKQEFMELSFVEQILKDIASWPSPLPEIVPTNFTEWMNNPQWHDMGRMIGEYLPATPIVLPTTGVLLVQNEALKKLASISTLRWTNFSLNAYFKETWARTLRVSERLFPKVLALPEKFRALRPDVTINISMVYDPQLITEKERELFQNYWQSRGFRVSINNVSYAKNPKRVPEPPVVISCRSIFDGLVVFLNGQVGTGCCFSGENELPVGRFPEQKLLEIWRGDQLRALGNLHNTGRRAELEICKTCSFA